MLWDEALTALLFIQMTLTLSQGWMQAVAHRQDLDKTGGTRLAPQSQANGHLLAQLVGKDISQEYCAILSI